MGDCWPWGGAGEELLGGVGATLDGTAVCRPNRGCGPRAAAEATRHNVTKPHRPRTYRDRVKPEQAPQGTTGRGLGWSRRPQVDRTRSTILERSRGRQTGGATVGLYITADRPPGGVLQLGALDASDLAEDGLLTSPADP